MNVEGRWRRTIEAQGDHVIVLDQARLPYAIEWLPLRSLADVCRAIRDMHIRGAPLIGVTAAYGVAIAMRERISIDAACAELAATRPTAINLRWALGQMRAPRRRRRRRRVRRKRRAIADADVAICEAIGARGQRAVPAAGTTRSTCSPTATPAGSRRSTGAPRSRRSTRRTKPASTCTSGSTRRGRATRAC